MKFDKLLEKYTKEYEKYLKMGLSKDDAVTLIEKHIKADVDIHTMSPYDLITLFAGEDVWRKTFDAFDAELDALIKDVKKIMSSPSKKVSSETLEQCDAPLVERQEETKPSCEGEGRLDVIADEPKHKEFRVTYPNGYYKYKMLVK